MQTHYLVKEESRYGTRLLLTLDGEGEPLTKAAAESLAQILRANRDEDEPKIVVQRAKPTRAQVWELVRTLCEWNEPQLSIPVKVDTGMDVLEIELGDDLPGEVAAWCKALELDQEPAVESGQWASRGLRVKFGVGVPYGGASTELMPGWTVQVYCTVAREPAEAEPAGELEATADRVDVETTPLTPADVDGYTVGRPVALPETAGA